jgi:cobyrinic acid a,c-diamide synthase
VLVVEASRQAGSVAALVRGFRDHQNGLQMAGVVLNGVGSERHHALLAEALTSIAMPLLGALPRHNSLELPSRHLGLLPAHELEDLAVRQGAWADLAERHLNLEKLWPLLAAPAANAENSAHAQALAKPAATTSARIAIASDAAFHFRYPEAEELLAGHGVDVQSWSPLADEPLPPGSQAIVLPGGYPELHAEQLATSQRSLQELQRAHHEGVPIYAECGGLLLLGQHLSDGEGNVHAMAGLLPFSAQRGALSLGYRTATALQNGLVLQAGEQVCGHEFHRWQLQGPMAETEQLWQLEGWGSPARPEGWSRPTLHASWLHLHWGGCPFIPQRLAEAARRTSPLPPLLS